MLFFFFCFFSSCLYSVLFFFSSRRRHTRSTRDWSSDVCSSDLGRRARINESGEAATRSQEHTESWPVCRRHLMEDLTTKQECASAFDARHPPSNEIIEKCVHCGFCLPVCPTYVLWGQEMDSPRGRIYLMKLASEGATE